jgi:hypothetical protein
LAEAKYLVDRIVAASSVPEIGGMHDIVPIGSIKTLRGLRADPLLRDMSYLDEPLVSAKETTRFTQLCQSAQTILAHRGSRRLLDVPDAVVNGVAIIAQDLADVKDYQTAVSVAILGGVLGSYRLIAS